jgi:signal transduction histidine kinase
MIRLIPFAEKFLTSGFPFENTETFRKVVLINSILLFATLIFLAFGVYNSRIGHIAIALLDFGAAALSVGAMVDLRLNKNVVRAGEIGIWTLFGFFISFVMVNQNNDFGLIWTIFFPVFVILIRSRSGIPHIVLFYAVLFFLAYTNIGVWQQGQWGVAGFIRLAAASTLLTYVVYVSEQARSSMDRKNRELLQREKEYSARLQQYQSELESKVKKSLEELSEKEKIILRQSQMAEMGNLIGIIAHQLKQPLNAISIGVYDIEEANRYGELDAEYLKRSSRAVQKQVQHMAATIDDFRDFFNPNKKCKPFNLANAIQKTFELLMPQLDKSGIKVILSLDKRLECFGFESELQQVIINLVHNAKDVLLEKKVDNPTITITLFSHNQMKAVRVVDNGGGIPEAVVAKIFDPYFTTKAENGTGIGLYLARKIVTESFNGKLEAENIPEGAQFSIYLP